MGAQRYGGDHQSGVGQNGYLQGDSFQPSYGRSQNPSQNTGQDPPFNSYNSNSNYNQGARRPPSRSDIQQARNCLQLLQSQTNYSN